MTHTHSDISPLKDPELRFWLALSRRLPRLRGCGKIGGLITRFYNRKQRHEVLTDVLGFKMRLLPRECVDDHLLFCPHLYERIELGVLREFLKPGDVFVDGGANIGFYSLVLSTVVGAAGRVVAVEADPTNFERLQEHIKINNYSNISAVNVGLSDTEHILKLGLNRSGNQSGNSFLISGDESVEVQCRPLLSVLKDAGVRRVDAAKFDIEGFEYRVLKAFLETAPSSLIPKLIVIEHNHDFIERAGGDALELLRSHKFKVTKLKDQDYLAIREL